MTLLSPAFTTAGDESTDDLRTFLRRGGEPSSSLCRFSDAGDGSAATFRALPRRGGVPSITFSLPRCTLVGDDSIDALRGFLRGLCFSSSWLSKSRSAGKSMDVCVAFLRRAGDVS